MGIPTDPGEWVYGDDSGCWLPGKTPKVLHVSVSGVMFGDNWVPAWGPPPNGSYSLTQWAPASYFRAWMGVGWDEWRTHVPGTYCVINGPLGPAFVANDPSNCVFAIPNNSQDPNSIFYGGQCVVTQKEPATSGAPSFADIMELINMQGRGSRKCEAFPLDNDELVAMFADLVESTRIRIKYNFS